MVKLFQHIPLILSTFTHWKPTFYVNRRYSRNRAVYGKQKLLLYMSRPLNIFLTLFPAQKNQFRFKVELISKVRIKGTIENNSYLITWIELNTVFESSQSVRLSIRPSVPPSVCRKKFSWELKYCVKMEDVRLYMEAQIQFLEPIYTEK